MKPHETNLLLRCFCFCFMMFKNQLNTKQCHNMQKMSYRCLKTNRPSGYTSQEGFKKTQIKRGLMKPHGTNSLLKRFSGFYKVIFYTSIFTGLHNLKLAKCYWFSKHRPFFGPMLSISQFVRPSVSLSVCLSVCPSVYFWGTI